MPAREHDGLGAARSTASFARTRFGSLAQGDCASRTWSALREEHRDRCEDCSAFWIVREDGSYDAPGHRKTGPRRVRMEA